MKINFRKILNIAGAASKVVKVIKGDGSPVTRESVTERLRDVLPQLEALAGRDLAGDAEWNRLLDAALDAEASLYASEMAVKVNIAEFKRAKAALEAFAHSVQR